ncbi:MAG: MMPL family transporter [Bacteroidota bacterium]
MWYKLSKFILKYRLLLIIAVGIVTAIMGYYAQFTRMSYEMISIVPDDDPDAVYFDQFKELFGQDGNIIAFGFQDSAVYELENFRRVRYMIDELDKLEGVIDVLGLPNLQKLEKNPVEKKFDFVDVFPDHPASQEELDSLLQLAASLKFYSGQLLSPTTGASVVVISLDKEIINSEDRIELIYDIQGIGYAFEEVTGIDVHIAGLPYVRTTNMTRIKGELNQFLILSIVITAAILFFFFRSVKAVLIPLVIIGAVILWVIGSVELFGYRITALTGLIPSIIVVIGIPNSVYLLNKYHHEFSQHGDHHRALRQIIRKIGIITLITNATTAIGFLVLISTQIPILMEFGIIAGLNILATFIVSIILLPSIFSYMKPPDRRHLKHLEFPLLQAVLRWLDLIVRRHRPAIFFVTLVMVGVSVFGLLQIKALSYLVDDLPESTEVMKDLRFFERNFEGIMPLELVVDTGTKNGVKNLRYLREVDEFQSYMDSLPYVSQPISIVTFIKAAKQAFYNDSPTFYALPTNRERGLILQYLEGNEEQKELSESFVDSTGQIIRVSLKVADIGSSKMDSLVNDVIRPKIDEYFEDGKLSADITGTTYLFIKGNKFLIENLITSMVIAFVIIAFIMAILFRKGKMIVISLIPTVIPLLMTGAIMGYFGIPLKPSTALVFSIAFGISVDDSIHFLAKYRQEMARNGGDVSLAISVSIRETGTSMIYTSIILFFGFVIFSFSQFGGTIALGQLTSITLLIAMLTNVIVLPALLMQFDHSRKAQTNDIAVPFSENGQGHSHSSSEILKQ